MPTGIPFAAMVHRKGNMPTLIGAILSLAMQAPDLALVRLEVLPADKASKINKGFGAAGCWFGTSCGARAGAFL